MEPSAHDLDRRGALDDAHVVERLVLPSGVALDALAEVIASVGANDDDAQPRLAHELADLFSVHNALGREAGLFERFDLGFDLGFGAVAIARTRRR